MNPVAPIAHLIAIAVGILGGLWLGGVISPDLPSAETEPGVAVGEEVKGSDPDSLYRSGPLQEAVTQTLEQLGPGAEVSNVTIEPSRLHAAENEGVNLLPLEDMPVDAPERIVTGLEEARRAAGGEGPVTLDDVMRFSWSPANPTNSEWYVLLDITKVDPPTEFSASRDGSQVSPGSP